MFASFFNKSSPNMIKIYIPRILGSVTQITLRTTFERLNIGKVFYVDMHRKINENKRVYYFAFLDIELYNTMIAKKIYELLNKNELVKLVYDEEAAQYWELKKHLPKNERQTNRSGSIDSSSSIMPVSYEKYMQNFSEEVLNEDVIVFDYDAYLSGKPYNMWENDFDLHSSIMNM